MKKTLVLGALTLIVTAIVTAQGSAVPATKYDSILQSVGTSQKVDDPNGKPVHATEQQYKANNSKKTLKKVEELPGYVDDQEIEGKSGKNLKKSLMTYKEYINLGIDPAFRHDIDADRMVWVLQTKFTKTTNINGVDIVNPLVTTVYDAETGDQIAMTVSTDAPNGLANVKHAK
ncbi:hypothetical protein JJB07_18305 [Tumebacillus sp. ITR2]|uniref:Uncharacterized protein n=1 Tax=Tumebacillus amylolyticus TaxID=2801339 RepID=A0ABS1JEC7_9BACL|nr:hypothetical protein [Tumebacillus amylolyticus]MBL0388560.1 hypothetical protein [Tumebacillus amylolyticus]